MTALDFPRVETRGYSRLPFPGHSATGSPSSREGDGALSRRQGVMGWFDFVLSVFPLLMATFTPLAFAQTDPAAPAPADEPPAEETTEATDNPGFAQLKVDLTPRENITVGDQVRADLELVWMGPEPTETPRFPTWQETWGSAEVLSASEVESFTDQSQRRIYRQTVTLTAFRVGEVRLPSVTVAVPLTDQTEELKTESTSFEIISVLPDAGEDAESGDEEAEGDAAGATPAELEPRPAAPLEELGQGTLYLWVTGLLAFLCLLAAVRLARYSPAFAGTIMAKPRLAPLAELLERLRALDPSQGSEPVHTGISMALRDYLGRLLGIQALEGTTSEIQKHLRATAVPPALSQRAIRLLRECDQVKFARLEVDESVTDDRVALAQNVAREIQETTVQQALGGEPVTEAG